ncbi:MAG: permease [Bacteroidales bacterium]|nr:permease [Bacteroidales bacterium]MCF8343852.1 permease [Bacteroidales bacterium]MCF8349576.1 permease [Bacteroidales bacterium]MCF8375135.1 permease [Bacteroidales bacterium]MCF8400042.1 permease [Bacteroidales bacterium]
MEKKREFKLLAWIIAVFVFAYFMPLDNARFKEAIMAMFDLTRWYAQEHVILCLLPAFFIAGVIAVFVSQGAVMKYFGAKAKKWVAYTVASVSGTILAVCSCTILPLFSSIHKRGAGLGPAIAFLYSGPAINILAIILTARILGFEMGVARIIGAVVFAVVIGSVMSFIYSKEEKVKKEEQLNFPETPEKRPMWQTAFHFFTLVLILVFANWGKPGEGVESGTWYWIWSNKWHITAGFALLLIFSLIYILKLKWQYVIIAALATALSAFLSSSPLIHMVVGIAGLSIITLTDKRDPDNKEWTLSTWDFTKQIMPLLAIGVLIAGFLLGSTHDDTAMAGIIPNEWVASLVGGNSVFSNFFASIVGAFMYFATLTEVPILQGLIAAGMGKGPALALLLAGPSLSLPNMLVIRGVIGTQKTLVYVLLVVIMATLSGLIYGTFF